MKRAPPFPDFTEFLVAKSFLFSMFMRCFLFHIAEIMDYSLTLHNCNLAVITTAGLMTFVDHLENLAALKTYICQRITTLGKAPCLNYCEWAFAHGHLRATWRSLPEIH